MQNHPHECEQALVSGLLLCMGIYHLLFPLPRLLLLRKELENICDLPVWSSEKISAPICRFHHNIPDKHVRFRIVRFLIDAIPVDFVLKTISELAAQANDFFFNYFT